MNGILLVDKPSGWTSFDVVNYVRKMVAQIEGKKPKNTKVGHTGTLDPMATGLLVLLIGKDYTRRAAEFSKLDKTYEVVARLGQTSTTGDEEGEKTPYDMHQPACFAAEPQTPQASSAYEHFSPAILRRRTVCTPSCVSRRENAHKLEVQGVGQCGCHVPTEKEVLEALERFRGQIEQVPPQYSAIKINGQRAYDLARKGKIAEIEPRTVRIDRLELTKYEYPDVSFVCDVSSGTYIRSLVEDIGKALGTGAYTASLRRTKVGKFSLEHAITQPALDVDAIASHLIMA